MTESHKRRDFRENFILHKMHVFLFSLQLTSETFLILRGTERDMIGYLYRSPCEVAVIIIIF